MRFFQRLFYSFFFVAQSLFAMGLLQDAPCVSLYHLAPFLPDSIPTHTTRVQRGNPVSALLFSGATEADFQLVIECMAKKADCRVLRCSAQFIGSVMDTFKKVKKVQCPTIIILDDLANIDAAQSTTLYRHLRALKKIDGLCTVSWAPDATKLSENIQHHFNIPLKLALPTEQQRIELLKKLISVYVRSHAIDSNHFVQKTAGWSIANIVTLVQNSAQNMQSDAAKSPQECFEAVYQAMQSTKESSKNAVFAGCTIQYTKPTKTFADLEGDLPERLLYVPKRAKKNGWHRGILLYGHPGNGKTSIAEAIASEIGWKYIYCTGASFASIYHDGSTVHFQKAIEALETSKEPTVLFIDECEPLFASPTNSPNNLSHQSLLAQLKPFIDKCNENTLKTPILVIAATNYPEMIEGAVKNRLSDHTYEIQEPDDASRERLIANFICKITNDTNCVTTRTELINNIKMYSKGLSIREIEKITLLAKALAENNDATTITDRYFYRALSILLFTKLKNGENKAKQKDSLITAELSKDIARETVVRTAVEKITKETTEAITLGIAGPAVAIGGEMAIRYIMKNNFTWSGNLRRMLWFKWFHTHLENIAYLEMAAVTKECHEKTNNQQTELSKTKARIAHEKEITSKLLPQQINDLMRKIHTLNVPQKDKLAFFKNLSKQITEFQRKEQIKK